MKRRFFLLSGTASAVGAALTACGGGGGAADAAGSQLGTAATGATVGSTASEVPASTAAAPAPAPATTSTASTDAAPSTSQTTTQQPSTSTQAASSGFPAKVLACYFTAWDTAYRITDVPTDFNVIYLFNAQNPGTNSGDGSWTWPFGGDVTPAQIQQVRQRGQKVILTVGGAGLGFVYTDRTQSTNCVNSIKSIISQIGGVDGVDFNNYEAGIVNAGNLSAMSTEMVWIAQQLRATYGSSFAITSPPSPNDTYQQSLMAAMKNAGVLTYAAPQFYDWSGFNAVGYISNAINTWVALLGESNVAVGLSANYSNGPALSDCTREWSTVKAAHPGIRGMFCWSAQTNLQGGNSWGSTMGGSL